ncbi:MAG: PilZ domain-containing protein [Thermodesulfobacteriota bacterium]
MRWLRFERRKCTRIDASLDVRLVIIGEGSEGYITSRTILAKTETISTNGACLITNVVQIDGLHICSSISGLNKNKLKLEIDLPSNYKTITLTGEVCWYDLAFESDEYLYKVGVSFIDMNEDNKETLNSFIAIQRKERKKQVRLFLKKFDFLRSIVILFILG